ncbi:polysaccharide biosynthesis tyrosine autokinase [Puniceicoccaceae bacterium K14]|nr:polysaccharide biosynthesis tyrosine autokinase [Puniceicoccaceae bacterium K14]
MEEEEFYIQDKPTLGVLDYLRIVRERWLLGAAIGLLVAGIVLFSQLSKTPLYTSSLNLVVEESRENVVDMDEIVDSGISSRSGALLKQHLLDMRSRNFRTYLESQLSKRDVELIKRAYISEELKEPKLSDILRDGLSISLNSRDLVYTIGFTHRDSQIAAMVANRFAEEYIEYVLTEVGSTNRSALSFLRNNAEKIQASILDDERSLQRFRKRNGIISPGENRSILVARISRFNEENATLGSELQHLETVLGVIDESNKSEEDDYNKLLQLSDIASYGSVEALRRDIGLAIAKREALAVEHLERHPKVIQNEKYIAERQELLGRQIEMGQLSIQVRIDNIKTQVEANREEITRAEKEAQELDSLTVLHDSLEQKIENSRSMLHQIESRLNETTITSQLSKANMRVVDEAVEPYSPSSPNRKKSIMTAAMLFMVSLIGVPILVNMIDDRLKTPWDIEEFVGKSLLGEIHQIKGDDKKANLHDAVVAGEDNVLVDTFRSIYNRVQLVATRNDRKVQLITSTIPNEGKTIFSMNYSAVSASHGNKVLLIDCDFRKPQIQKYLGVKPEKGLVTWLKKEEEFENAGDRELFDLLGIQELDKNRFLLPAGVATNKSTEYVESQRFKELLERLSDEFDHIIMDTPPLGVFPDAAFMASYVQDVIYVCSHNRVSRKMVKHFTERLDETQANVCGIILNGRKAGGRFGSYGDGNYGYNYNYASKYYEKYYRKS